MSVGRLEEIEAPDAGHEPWLSHTDRLPFPVEWSAQFDVLSGGEARQAIQRKLLVVRDMQRHYREHDLDEPLALDRQARQARQVEDQMSRGVEVAAARVHGWFRLAVSGTDRGGVPRARPQGEVLLPRTPGQHRAPARASTGCCASSSPVSRSPPRRTVGGSRCSTSRPGCRPRRARSVTGAAPTSATPPASSRRAVMFDTHYATEEKETSGLVPVVGGLGAGQERAARPDHLRGRAPRHPLGGAGPLRAAGPAHRAARVPRARRAHRPHHRRQRHAEPVRRRRQAAPRVPTTSRTRSRRRRCWRRRTASCWRWTW